MIEEYKFIQLINGIENLPKELLNYNSILYRIHDYGTNKNYIGTAKYGLPGRLYDRFYGHVVYYKNLNENKLKGMYKNINDRTDDFSLIVEYVTSPENYEVVLQKETELIKKFDSVLHGYNVSVDGKPGWKEGTVCVNNGVYDLYIYPEDINRFLEEGFSIGSCKHSFLKGFIWINNGIESRLIDPEDYELFKKDGFIKGNLISPNKGKVWMNNGSVSKLVNKSEIDSIKQLGFNNFGRIEEKPRNSRGKYDPSKKRRSVNNGDKELRILVDEVDEFLKNNPNFKLGKIKGKILVSNENSRISKFIDKKDLDDYMSKGFKQGKLNKS